MQTNKIIQNTSDIKPAGSGTSFVAQKIVKPTNLTEPVISSIKKQVVKPVNPTAQLVGGVERKVDFQGSFLAQVEEKRQKPLQQPSEISFGRKQVNNFSSNVIADGIVENRNIIEESQINNINFDDEKIASVGYKENFSFVANEGVNKKADEKADLFNKSTLPGNVEIGSINYGMHSGVENELGELLGKPHLLGHNNLQKAELNVNSLVNRKEAEVDRKMGSFLNQETDDVKKDAGNENYHDNKNSGYLNDGQKKAKKKRFLLSVIGENRLSLFPSPFITAVLATSFVVMLTGFVSLSLHAKNDIEVRGARAVNYIKEAKIDLQNKNFKLATTNLISAKKEFKNAQEQIDKLGGSSLDIFAHIPFLSKISSGKNVVALGDGLTDAVVRLASISELLEGVGNPLDLEDKSRSSLTNIFVSIQKSINLSKKSLNDAEKASAKIKVSDLPEEYQGKIQFIKDFLPLVNDNLDEFDRFAEIFLELFGHNGPRKYLIVFQNNQEMRATGGFIGSYGLLETSQGKIDRLKIEGIYNPDGQLRVNVVPPRPIQKISAGWSTHDANWWPDFPKSAEKLSWFYEKTGGPTVDGVIAVTPVLLQKMLGVTGPIEMEKYNKTITSKNFIKEIQQEVEVDYKEANKNSGDEEEENKDPKKILADLTPIIFAKFFDLSSPKQAGQVIKILLDALKEKHILINFVNTGVQNIVSDQGWAGEILKTEKDYLMVINSNINGYKTDGVVEEKIKHHAEIQADGSVIDTVTIIRKHNGGNTNYEWWNKVNADYMRVYVPEGSKLISAEGHTREINNERLNYDKLGFQADADVEAEENYMKIDETSGTRIYKESGKTVFANWVYVSPQERTTVVYKYLLPFKVELTDGENNRYSLLMQKQSGSVNSTIKAEIEFPFAWSTTWVEPKNLQIDKRNGKLLFGHELDTDQFIGVVFK